MEDVKIKTQTKMEVGRAELLVRQYKRLEKDYKEFTKKLKGI